MRVYVAGPLTIGDQAANVRAAIDAGDRLLSAGHCPFVPHLTVYWHAIHAHDYEQWMDWCLNWLSRCQALVRLPGESKGADREVEKARVLSIPVFTSVEFLLRGIRMNTSTFTHVDSAISLLVSNRNATMTINDAGDYVVTWVTA